MDECENFNETSLPEKEELNLYIVYELNNWSRNPTNNFTLNCLFDPVYLVQSNWQ